MVAVQRVVTDEPKKVNIGALWRVAWMVLLYEEMAKIPLNLRPVTVFSVISRRAKLLNLDLPQVDLVSFRIE